MRRAIWLAAAALIVGEGAPALARSSGLLAYPAREVWPTAVRFLRIDRGAAIREKDAESGYLLFDLPEANKVWKGSLELVRTSDPEGREATRVVVTLPDLPRHFETILIDKLTLKVKEEYGSPAPAPPRRQEPTEAPPRITPDAGVLPRPPSTQELPRPKTR